MARLRPDNCHYCYLDIFYCWFNWRHSSLLYGYGMDQMKDLELILERASIVDKSFACSPSELSGIRWENARLLPLITSLLEIVREQREALEKVYCPNNEPPVFLGMKHSD